MRGVVWGAAALLALAAPLGAQTQVSVPFTQGFVGTRGSNPGEANVVKTYATLGIARTFFIQSSSTSSFQLQGNDIPGTLRIVRTNGTTLDIPASANWRNSGGTTYLIGILPRPASPITFTYGGGSIQITDGTVNGGTSVGGYVAAYAGSTVADGASENGNAAQSQVLDGLNAYLSTVAASRPAGPVTVTAQSTASTTPTLAGTVTLAAGEQLSVVVAGVEYSASSTPAVAVAGGAWSLALASPLAVGTYAVTATVTDADGFTLSDATTNELTVTAATTTVTLGGTLAANDRVYDGTTVATGATGGLSLTGVQGGHQVTIAAVTLAFQSAAVGAAKTVTITGVTLGGTHAAQYTASLAGAPTATASVTARPLTVTGVAAVGRAYDGTTAVALSGTAAYANLAAGESFAVAGSATASVATAGVGAGKPVTVAGYLAPSANYSVSQPAGLTATITARPATVGGGFSAADKTYDGSAAATITANALTVANVVAGESLTLQGVAAAFASAAVGSGKAVAITAATLAGATAAHYTLSLAGAPTTTASITAAAPAGGTVTVAGTLSAHDKVYDGTVAASGSAAGLSLAGVQGGHQVTVAGVTLAFQSASVGAGKTVTITGVTLGGADAAQYAVSLAGAPTATASITAADPGPSAPPSAPSSGGVLTVAGAFTAHDKQYDGLTIATGSTGGLTLAGVAAGDQVSVAAVTLGFADAAVGQGKRVAITGVTLAGAQAGLYAVSLAGAPTAAASIAPRQVTVGGSFTAADKPFDGTTAATLATSALRLVGAMGGHDVALAGVTVAFADPAVGAGKRVAITGARLAGAASAFYTLSLAGAPDAAASIVAAAPPSAPRAVAAAAGDGALVVTWAPPADAGCRAVTGYVVEATADEARGWTRVAAAASPATVAGLVNNLAYRVRVAAVNPCGTGPSAAGAPAAPVGPARDGSGRPAPVAPGVVAVSSGGTPRPATTTVVEDTIVRVAGQDFTLRLRALDQPGAAIPVDSTRALALEQGGRAAAEGTGFAPGSRVTLYLVAPDGAALLLGAVDVGPDGAFAGAAAVPAALAAGDYTLQVNGVDAAARPRAVALGVEVAPPPPDLALAASPDRAAPAAGDTVVITLTVTNEGRGAATDVVIPRAFREPGFAVVRAAPLEGSYRADAQEWTIPRIEPGARARLLLTAVVLAPVPPPAPQPTQP